MKKSSASVSSSHEHQSTSFEVKRSKSRNPDDNVDVFITVPPDGGWGWVVVATSFTIDFLVDGVIFTSGLFLDDLAKTFETHPTRIAMALSLCAGLCLLAGPVVCALINRYGFRLITICGGILTGSAFILSSMVSSLALFFVVNGVIGGIGFSFLYVPSVVVIGFYFERWRGLAMSIASTGSAVGMTCFPFAIRYALGSFTWQTKFRIISGSYFLCSVLAVTYRPLLPVRVLTDDKKIHFIGNTASSIGSFHLEKRPGFLRRLYNKFHNSGYPTVLEVHDPSSVLVTAPKRSSTSVFVASTADSATIQSSASDIVREFSSKTIDKSERLSTVIEEVSLRPKRRKWLYTCCGYRRRKDPEFVTVSVNRPMYRDDILYNSSLFALPEYARAISSGVSPSKFCPVDYHMSVSRIMTQRDIDEERQPCKCCPESIKRTLTTMFSCALLTSPSFVLLTISGFLTVIGLYTPFIYIEKFANEAGYKDNHFLSTLGASNAIGRIMSGVIVSFPRISNLFVSYASLLIGGGTLMLVVVWNDIYGMYGCCAILGIAFAPFPALRAPLLVDLVGLKQLTNGMGIITLFQGIAGFVGVSVSGIMAEVTGSYKTCFLFSACTILLSAVILVPIKPISKWEKRRQKISRTGVK